MIYIQPDQIINFIGAILGGGIIGAIISALATIFYGERRVETLRRRREHSIKLNDDVFKKWLDKVGDYIKNSVSYSKDSNDIVGIEPKDPINLLFYDEAKKHLESKYPDILYSWEDLKTAKFHYNKERATLFEEIGELIINEFKIPRYYSSLHGRTPEEHITIDRFLENIYEEITSRLRSRRKWMIGKPNIRVAPYGDKTFYELEWGSYVNLVRSLDKEKVKKALPLIDQLVEAPKFREKVKNLLRVEEEYLPKTRKSFEAKIKEVIKSIELGNVLKGKCQHCP